MREIHLQQIPDRSRQKWHWFRQAEQVNRPLTWLTAAMVLIALCGFVGIFVDGRIIVGQPAWAKTTKFAISIGVYSATLLWFFSVVQGYGRFLRFFLNATAGILSLEMLLLITQAVRGHAMHFNYSTPLDGALYTVMAASIYILFALTLVAALFVWRQKQPSWSGRAFDWSIKLGLAITVIVGFGVANLMVRPTSEQMAQLAAGDRAAGSVIGAHTVGAEDGGPGLPLLGWSTEHGDLRIPHFFGLHALQIVPLVGWFVARQRRRWLTERHQLALIGVTAVAYTGWVALVTWQALRGQPFMAPDALTLTALVGLVSVTLLSGGSIVAHAYIRKNAL